MRMALNSCRRKKRAPNIQRSVHAIWGRALGMVCRAHRHFVNRVHKIAFLGRVIHMFQSWESIGGCDMCLAEAVQTELERTDAVDE